MVCGVMSAAPTPWAARAAISIPIEPDRPQSSDVSVKMTRPTMKTGRGPNRSPSRPVTSSRVANVSR